MDEKPRPAPGAPSALPDLDLLLHFGAVAQAGSLRLASIRQGVSQSTLSRSMAALERGLGLRLLERSRHGVRLTAAGAALQPRVQALGATLDRARQAVAHLQNTANGKVRLAIPATLSGFLLPPLFHLYAAELADTRLSILEGSARHIHQWLKTGEADVGVIVGPSRDGQISAELLFEEDLYLMCVEPPADLHEGTLPFARLAELPLVLPLMPLGSRQVLEAMARQEGIALVPTVEVDSPGIQKLLVLSHGLASVFSRLVCRDELQAGRIRAVPIRPAPRRAFYIATRQGEPLSQATRLLAHLLRRVAGGLGAMD